MWISLNDREKKKSYCVKKSPFTERRSTLTVCGRSLRWTPGCVFALAQAPALQSRGSPPPPPFHIQRDLLRGGAEEAEEE